MLQAEVLMSETSALLSTMIFQPLLRTTFTESEEQDVLETRVNLTQCSTQLNSLSSLTSSRLWTHQVKLFPNNWWTWVTVPPMPEWLRVNDTEVLDSSDMEWVSHRPIPRSSKEQTPMIDLTEIQVLTRQHQTEVTAHLIISSSVVHQQMLQRRETRSTSLRKPNALLKTTSRKTWDGATTEHE